MPQSQTSSEKSEAAKRRMRQLIYRMDYLPEQIERTHAKLDALEKEARRYGMTHLIKPRKGLNNDN